MRKFDTDFLGATCLTAVRFPVEIRVRPKMTLKQITNTQ